MPETRVLVVAVAATRICLNEGTSLQLKMLACHLFGNILALECQPFLAGARVQITEKGVDL
ncbi:hypothetical protein SAMN05444166_0490 [Singulisphaera sp. GP187]|nr:hypothetical protein SAMN05444166_0490 [Singulisphaera sp. GP187]